MPNPGLFEPGLGSHEPGPRAGDIGFPVWIKNELSGTFFPSGPSFEGVVLFSRAIMTGKLFLRNSEFEILACFQSNHFGFSHIQ
jgi:hypothetical protein